ncbi:helix-turn-helix domain-containing protein [Janibacter sp. DB-40]|uniref:helix-turn-helix domain-containing protein n=1 Tax=Janibacter sp. DB-40 TaxID=3028808 RepID=UPI002405DF87|nr:helix-turn-helix domain-containing protein [Janibacter sp. DB-40]
MARTAASAHSHTYLPDGANEAEILDFIGALERAGGQAPAQRPAVVAADGTRHEIPESMVDVLRQVAEALSAGMGVNVAPLNSMLTTQEAADFLGISRPTFVRILERGEVPMEKPGRHRYVRLRDLLDYQERVRTERRDALGEMVRAGQESDLYEAADGIPPAMR